MSKIAHHTSSMSPPHLFTTILFLSDLVRLAGWNDAADSAFLHSFFRCQALFSYLLRGVLMVPDRFWWHAPEGFRFDLILETIPLLVTLCADKALVADVEEKEAFLRTCCQADIFLAIQAVISLMAEDFPDIYCTSFHVLSFCRTYSSNLLASLFHVRLRHLPHYQICRPPEDDVFPLAHHSSTLSSS